MVGGGELCVWADAFDAVRCSESRARWAPEGVYRRRLQKGATQGARALTSGRPGGRQDLLLGDAGDLDLHRRDRQLLEVDHLAHHAGRVAEGLFLLLGAGERGRGVSGDAGRASETGRGDRRSWHAGSAPCPSSDPPAAPAAERGRPGRWRPKGWVVKREPGGVGGDGERRPGGGRNLPQPLDRPCGRPTAPKRPIGGATGGSAPSGPQSPRAPRPQTDPRRRRRARERGGSPLCSAARRTRPANSRSCAASLTRFWSTTSAMTTSLPNSFPWLITHTRPISTNALNEPMASALLLPLLLLLGNAGASLSGGSLLWGGRRGSRTSTRCVCW